MNDKEKEKEKLGMGRYSISKYFEFPLVMKIASTRHVEKHIVLEYQTI